MIVEIIRYELSTSSADSLIRAYDQAAQHLRAAPECLAYEMTVCEEASNVYLLRIEWASTEAHLQGFRRGQHFPPFLALIRPFVGEIAEMRHYRRTDLRWSRQRD